MQFTIFHCMRKFNITSLCVPGKLMLPICIGIMITLLFLFCKDGEYRAKVVSEIPEGFVPLLEFIEFNERTDNILEMSFWEEQVSFCLRGAKFGQDCIFRTSIKDSDYFVEYNKKDYINETKYIKLVGVATHTLEQRQRIYNLGDEVEVLGAGETVYKVKIISLEAIETESCDTNSYTTYHIKYVVTPNVVESKQSLFARVETKDGRSINIGDYEDYIIRNGSNFFDIVRIGGPVIIDKETVSVKIRASKDSIEAIILRSPYYDTLEYRVVVNLESVPIEAKVPKMEMKSGLLFNFSKVKIGMKYNEVVELVGEPTNSVGSGLIWFRYKIDEGWYIKLFFGSDNTLIIMKIVDYPNNREFKLVSEKADMRIVDYP